MSIAQDELTVDVGYYATTNNAGAPIIRDTLRDTTAQTREQADHLRELANLLHKLSATPNERYELHQIDGMTWTTQMEQQLTKVFRFNYPNMTVNVRVGFKLSEEPTRGHPVPYRDGPRTADTQVYVSARPDGSYRLGYSQASNQPLGKKARDDAEGKKARDDAESMCYIVSVCLNGGMEGYKERFDNGFSAWIAPQLCKTLLDSYNLHLDVIGMTDKEFGLNTGTLFAVSRRYSRNAATGGASHASSKIDQFRGKLSNWLDGKRKT